MSEVRWRGGYEKKARQEEGKMSDTKERIELLERMITNWSDIMTRYPGAIDQKDFDMLTEIKKIVIDYYDLIERLTNINFPIEAKRKK